MKINIKSPKISTSFKTEKIYPQLEELTVTPGTEDQTFKSEKDGFSTVTIAGDSNLLEENIKFGVSIFGKQGTNADTSDADATSNDIAEGRTAYVNNQKVTGTFVSLDTSQIRQCYNMFYNNRQMIEVSYFDTSNVTSMYCMFYNCSALKTVPLFDVSSVTTMGSMFYGCSSLETVPLFDTSNVTNMSSMFYGCSSLETVSLPDTSNVTNMSSMFYDCSSLETVSLPDTSKVTTMNSMFYDCKNLKIAPNLITYNSTTFGNMFRGCSSLETVPYFNTSSITTSGLTNMFAGCTNLSDESLNNILMICITATRPSNGYRTLKYIGLTEEQATRCTTLSNYQLYLDAGLVTGY